MDDDVLGPDELSVTAQAAATGDDETIWSWSVQHLGAVENWLVRRGLLDAAAEPLHRARARFRAGPDEYLAAADLRARQPLRAERAPDGEPGLVALVERLRTDLPHYRASLDEAGLHHLSVAAVPSSLTAVFLSSTQELFVPTWLLDIVPHRLFGEQSGFNRPRIVASSWLLFQSLVLDEGPAGPRTMAAALGIRESD